MTKGAMGTLFIGDSTSNPRRIEMRRLAILAGSAGGAGGPARVW